MDAFISILNWIGIGLFGLLPMSYVVFRCLRDPRTPLSQLGNSIVPPPGTHV